MVQFKKISMKKFITTTNFTRFLFVALFLFWFTIVWKYSQLQIILPAGDFQRDTAITFNILAGNFLGDATYLGEHAFYPFLSHSLYVFYYLLTKISVITLYLKYPILLSIPTLVLFAFSTKKIFKSSLFAFIAFFSFLFIIPGTSYYMNTVAHPFVLTYGTLALAIYLFWRSSSSQKYFDWIIAGLGIALVIYSQPFAAFTLCGGITLYQLITRKQWRSFFLMVGVSFLLSSPFVLPFLTTYKLHAINTLNINFLQYSLTLDNLFYGYGNIRWVNCLLIISGIFLAFFRHRNLDRFLLALYFFDLFFVLWGLITSQIPILNSFQPSRSFVWQDLLAYTHFVAVYFFSLGVWFWLKQISGLKTTRLSRNQLLYFFVMFFLAVYGYLTIPRFIKTAQTWYPSQVTYLPYTNDWQALVGWINKNTSIYDVIMADQGPSYLFISGRTGRKIIATDNWHSNPFINQVQRSQDLTLLYATTDMREFKNLAKKYHVSYVVLSPYEEVLAQNGLQKFSDVLNFLPVFSSGDVRLYKVI